jgi:hypothetical protein
MYRYGRGSKEKRKTLVRDAILICDHAIRHSSVDWGILEALRELSRQLELYKSGKSKVKKGKHQPNKDGLSEAWDIVCYKGSKITWDKHYYYIAAGHIKTSASILKEQGIISCDIRWGGDWNSNGNLEDQSFMDLGHFEIKKG